MKKTHKALKIIGIILGILLALGIGFYFYVTSHTQIVVGFIQKGIYGENSPNSFEPLYTPGEGITAAGQYKINDIAYGTEYPNSFLDITYPDANTESDRPTLFYFHGGGFFAGSKIWATDGGKRSDRASGRYLCGGLQHVNVDYAHCAGSSVPGSADSR